MNTLNENTGRKFNAVFAGSFVAALVLFNGAAAVRAEEPGFAMEQVAVVGAEEAAHVTGSLPPKNETVAETVQRFVVHRSPIRTDSIALSVVAPDTQEEHTIELPGVAGVSFNKICRNSDGIRIACGSRARVQLVNFVTRKEITCKVTGTVGASPKVVSCAIEGQDLAEWIVRSGIGRPTVDGLHVAAVREARNSERGMWVDAETRNELVLAAQQ